ncbi:hypothetical protein [Actinokineospora fastidiosa]|uniref:DUF4190 domain-containing protein n=1 Tax=Actinokineospora fastidiosa TaxID=1816 RepID=A0A918GSK5_9PSEU|nr:hypothetical protein [Actinokineospora fastidiosa]GGS58452.1 hypothetical protein GCM10010171_61780 [Actinokineospora fastidiosa]
MSGPANPPAHPPTAAGPAAAPSDPAKGAGLGVLAVVLGAIGCLLLVAPFALTGTRAYLALGFALPGLALGIAGSTGRRRGNALAVAGSILGGIALGLAVIMLVAGTPKSSPNAFPDDRTAEILHNDLDVRLGERHAGTDGTAVTVTLRNKGLEAASFTVLIEVTGGGVCETPVSVDDLSPGASYQTEVGDCSSTDSGPPRALQLKVVKVTKE